MQLLILVLKIVLGDFVRCRREKGKCFVKSPASRAVLFTIANDFCFLVLVGVGSAFLSYITFGLFVYSLLSSILIVNMDKDSTIMILIRDISAFIELFTITSSVLLLC